MNATIAPGFFDPLFASDPDPWHFEGSWYEARKRELVLASLPLPHYGAVFEPGCAGGFVSEQLAQRCDSLLCWDGAQRAVEYTSRRLQPYPHANAGHGWIPDDWPDRSFDLIVLGELLYYLPEAAIQRLAQRCRSSLMASAHGASVVACHWLHPFENCPLGGERAHEILNEHLQLQRLAQWRDADFALDVWCTEPQSVAQREGRRG